MYGPISEDEAGNTKYDKDEYDEYKKQGNIELITIRHL